MAVGMIDQAYLMAKSCFRGKGFQMKDQAPKAPVGKGKMISIIGLYVAAGIIVLIGVMLCVFSAAGNVSFSVLNAQVPGVLFGAVIVFLGVRYFISVGKLKARVYQSDASFSWENFKRRRKSRS
jgi:hypothetical protein